MKTDLRFEDVWPIVECRDKWTEKKVREHTPVLVADLLDRRKLWHVSAADRVWVLFQCNVFEPAVYELALADVAEWALRTVEKRVGLVDPRSWKAISAVRRHARGEATDEELEDAIYADPADDVIAIVNSYAYRDASRILRRLAYWSKRTGSCGGRRR